MNFLRKWIRNLLGFSGREANGFIILLPLLIIIIASEPVYRNFIASQDRDYSHDMRVLDSLIAIWPTDTNQTVRELPARKTTPKVYRYFAFDPNTATEQQLSALGFPDFLVRRVVSYRQKGGKFNTPADLRKIYGMDSALFNSLKKYVLIEHRNGQTAKQLEKAAIQSTKPRLDRFDINEADTAALKSVYGIGTKLAERILRFRSGLGGFVSLDQLSEIYGLDTSVVNSLQKRAFIHDDFRPRRINLNTTTEQEMAAHPYISKPLAKTIVAWRFQHGAFKSVDEIKNLSTLKADDIVKIIPYLKVEE